MKSNGFHLIMLASIAILIWTVSFSQAQLANTKIAFTSNRDGNNEIYVMNSDGSEQKNLTQNAAQDRSPTWSPDSTMIAFQTNRGNADPNDFDIYKMNADGTNQIPLATTTTTGKCSPPGLPAAPRSLMFIPRSLLTIDYSP